MNNDRVILDETSRRAEEDDATVRRVRDYVVSDDAVGTTETDTVSPFLECVGAAWTDVVILDDHAGAGERPFGDVKTRPGAGVKRVNVFDLKTIQVRSAEWGFRGSVRTSCAELPPPISMLAPPEVGGAPALVPLI